MKFKIQNRACEILSILKMVYIPLLFLFLLFIIYCFYIPFYYMTCIVWHFMKEHYICLIKYV